MTFYSNHNTKTGTFAFINRPLSRTLKVVDYFFSSKTTNIGYFIIFLNYFIVVVVVVVDYLYFFEVLFQSLIQLTKSLYSGFDYIKEY